MGIPCLLGPVLCYYLCKRVCLIHMCHVNSSPNHLKVPRLRRAVPVLRPRTIWVKPHLHWKNEQLPSKEELTEESFFKILIINTLLMCFPCPSRFTTTSAASCAPSTKMTAFLINLSVCGMGQTGKKGLMAGSLPRGALSLHRPWAVDPKGVQPKSHQNRPWGLAGLHRWPAGDLEVKCGKEQAMGETLDSSFRTGSGDPLTSQKSYLIQARPSQSWVHIPKMKLPWQILRMNYSNDFKVCCLDGKLPLEAARRDWPKAWWSWTEFSSASFILCPQRDLWLLEAFGFNSTSYYLPAVSFWLDK